MECAERNLITRIWTLDLLSLVILSRAFDHLSHETYVGALEQERFDRRLLSPALSNFWLLHSQSPLLTVVITKTWEALFAGDMWHMLWTAPLTQGVSQRTGNCATYYAAPMICLENIKKNAYSSQLHYRQLIHLQLKADITQSTKAYDSSGRVANLGNDCAVR